VADLTTEPIPPLPAAEVGAWDDTADVIVVGLGVAGTCAAIEAAEAGADVIALERSGAGGGTSASSGGIIYLGGGTPVQEGCGFHDTAEDMFRFLVAACGPGADEAKIRPYCEESVDHYHWLVDHGLPFKAEFHEERDREPPTDAGLLYSGGEDSWPFTEVAAAAPRGHHPRHPDAAGGFIMQCLLGALERTATRVVTDTRVERLVVDEAGAVVGVEASEGGRIRRLRAGGGVVLTAGGFIHNPAMVEAHTPKAAHCAFYVGTDTDDGGGIRMGVGAGGAAVALDALECSLPLNPPRRISVGILVNGKGERFINEDTYNGRIGLEILLGQDEEAYLVFDEDGYVVNAVGMRATWVCETATELAEEIGLPAGALEATLDRYNEAAARGEDPDFHKVPELVRPLVPPLGAIDLRVANAIYAPFTLGGLDTTPDSEVRDPDGAVVPGLYAAGRTTAGIAVRGYVSGISLGDGSFFGRRAGRAAAGRRG
jgi:3-oxo-5alpha-steroid 4-dehydrogenase